jgi:hypothetical protein
MPINGFIKPPDNYRDDMINRALHSCAERRRSMTAEKQ